MLNTWKAGTDCCRWLGVDCQQTDRVVMLSLAGQTNNAKSSLSGTIPPSLSQLQSLIGIYLTNLRNLTGPFPAAFFRLPKLAYIYIENSKLSGPIPVNIGRMSQLGALSLAGNQFSGPIPDSISNLRQLTQLDLGGNLLTGKIPTGITRLTQLSVLTLERNHLSGPLPSFASFHSLRFLRLSHNKYSGPFPSSIAGLSQNLANLELGSNLFTGQIPDFLGNFRNLDTVDLSHNRFSGVVPKTFKNLTKIFNLDLSYNNLVDPFPQMNVKGIESLDLSYNKFHLGGIPTWVTSSPIIYSLKLANCGIKMKIENWKPSETYFYDFIDLSLNEISGSPVALLNNTEYLKGFWMSGNKLQFKMTDLKLPTTLEELHLSQNLISGSIPASVSKLKKLNVSKNRLCGRIPKTNFPASAFAGNDCLCGSPLPNCRS
ncbi:DNA damage-repair/toleration protein DRT100-like [Aristolochia californica]|uniref:DNA damage-repair/toleration protein DRT100-like n=1 Tax=Aristolochia californica TaxID=171875 RepID=UPI0035D9680F